MFMKLIKAAALMRDITTNKEKLSETFTIYNQEKGTNLSYDSFDYTDEDITDFTNWLQEYCLTLAEKQTLTLAGWSA